jgi:hypothetical protein
LRWCCCLSHDSFPVLVSSDPQAEYPGVLRRADLLVRSTIGHVIIPSATGHRVTPQMSMALEIISLLASGFLISESGERFHKVSGYQWLPAHREKARTVGSDESHTGHIPRSFALTLRVAVPAPSRGAAICAISSRPF